MSLSAGTRLGPYEIVALLGAGGMGEVYRARDKRLERDVAIKVLPEAFAPDPDSLRRFGHEARAIAALNHPHICQIYDIGPGYLVLEYLEGEPLHGPVAVEHALRLALQIASALEAAHQRGILHRDLKPANIMVTRTGTAKLLDFGLAKLMALPEGGVDDLTRTVAGTVLGTAAYMSPEQAEGRALDARSDVFSFGAVLYEMLSGRRAFAGHTAAQVVSAVLRDNPAPLQAPVALDRIVRRCLQKDPAQRFPTMADVRTALEQLSVKTVDQQPSIAVLPFADMSPGKDHEWFSDGLAEEILNALTHVPGLKVIARTSAFAFKGKQDDIRRIAEVLGVAHVLEGSVRKAGNRIRVTAQLITAADGAHLWSERYDRELADIFAIQDDIAQAIGTALEAKLATKRPDIRRHTPQLPAYEACLKGRHHHAKFTPESLARAHKYYERALSLDAGFALCHSFLSEHFLMRALIGAMPAHQAMPAARAAARKALDIDSELPEAQAMLAVVTAIYDLDWKEANRWCRFALAHDAVSAWVRYLCGCWCLLLAGRWQEATEQLQLGLREDPLNFQVRWSLAWCYLAAGREDDADQEWRQILEIDESPAVTTFFQATHRAFRGKMPEALVLAEEAHTLAPWNLSMMGLLAGVLVRTGDRARAEELIQGIGDGETYGAPEALALFHVVCSDMEQAAKWYEKAIEQRHPETMWMLGIPNWNPIRSTDQWSALARLMNLAEPA